MLAGLVGFRLLPGCASGDLVSGGLQFLPTLVISCLTSFSSAPWFSLRQWRLSQRLGGGVPSNHHDPGAVSTTAWAVVPISRRPSATHCGGSTSQLESSAPRRVTVRPVASHTKEG